MGSLTLIFTVVLSYLDCSDTTGWNPINTNIGKITWCIFIMRSFSWSNDKTLIIRNSRTKIKEIPSSTYRWAELRQISCQVHCCHWHACCCSLHRAPPYNGSCHTDSPCPEQSEMVSHFSVVLLGYGLFLPQIITIDIPSIVSSNSGLCFTVVIACNIILQ